MQCDVLDQEVQWIARGCVSDEALEQFGNPTTTGCIALGIGNPSASGQALFNSHS